MSSSLTIPTAGSSSGYFEIEHLIEAVRKKLLEPSSVARDIELGSSKSCKASGELGAGGTPCVPQSFAGSSMHL